MPFELDRVLSFGEVILGYFQLAIIVDIDIDWPAIWKKMVQWVKMFKFDLGIEIFNMPIIDYRAYFLLVAVFVPLAISVLSLLYFKSVGVILWYCVVLLALAALVVGSYMLANKDLTFGVLEVAPGWVFLAISALLLLCCLVAVVVYIVRHKNETRAKIAAYRRKMNRLRRLRKIRVGDASEEKVRELQAAEDAEQQLAGESNVDDDESFEEAAGRAWEEAQQMKSLNEPRKGVLFYLAMLLTIAAFTAIALVSLGIVNLSMFPQLPTAELAPFLALGKIAGFCFIGAAVALLMYTIITLFQGGRNLLRRIRIWLDKQFIRIILFILLVTYIPISQTLLMSWSCQEVSCPAGTRLPTQSQKISAKAIFLSVQNSTAQCVPCSFLTSGCPWVDSIGGNASSSMSDSCTCISELCQGETAVRFKQDAGIQCSEVRTFFAPISVIMGIAFVLGIPVLYYVLVRYHAAFLKRMRVHGDNLEERWKHRTRLSQNSAKSLYLSFEYRWRYYKVGLLAQKLLVVFCSIFIALHPTVLAIALCTVNFACLCLGLATQPYVSRVMDFLTTASNITLLASSVLAALLAFKVALPQALYIVVSVLNFVVPVFGMAIGFVVEWRMEKMAKARIAPAKEVPTSKKIEVQPILSETPLAEQTEPQPQQGEGKKEEEEEDRPLSPQMLFALDWQLNTQTLRYISTFFILVGVLSFVSLSIGFIGIFATSTTAVTGVIAPTAAPLNFVAALHAEFAGYETWDAFAHNCCCSMGENTTDIPLLEQWSCRNGIFKQRSRTMLDPVSSTTMLSGIALRSFCSAQFNVTAVCNLTHTNTGWFAVQLCAGSGLEGLSPTVLRRLW